MTQRRLTGRHALPPPSSLSRWHRRFVDATGAAVVPLSRRHHRCDAADDDDDDGGVMMIIMVVMMMVMLTCHCHDDIALRCRRSYRCIVVGMVVLPPSYHPAVDVSLSRQRASVVSCPLPVIDSRYWLTVVRARSFSSSSSSSFSFPFGPLTDPPSSSSSSFVLTCVLSSLPSRSSLFSRIRRQDADADIYADVVAR